MVHIFTGFDQWDYFNIEPYSAWINPYNIPRKIPKTIYNKRVLLSNTIKITFTAMYSKK